MANFLVENNILQGTATPATPIISDPSYEVRGVFSLNASNQLQATFWITKNGQLMQSDVTVASYSIFDKDGVAIGIGESGITPDANWQFITTPVNGSSILDLTHYVAKVTINGDGTNRTGYLGITLGE